MASVNKVILVGNLGRDPEMRYMPSGDAICNVSIATTDSWKDKASGEKKEQTEWHRVAFFGKLAEIAGQYLKKGSQVYVEGSLRTRKYQDKDGVEKYATEIRADSMQMLGGRQGGGDMPPREAPARQQSGGGYGGGNNYGGYDSAPPPNYPSAPSYPPSAPSAPSRPASNNFGDMEDDIPF